MSFTFNDNGEEWTIWQFEDKGEKIQLATKNLNTSTYFYIDFLEDNFLKIIPNREKILSEIFGFRDIDVFDNINEKPYVKIKSELRVPYLIQIKNFIRYSSGI